MPDINRILREAPVSVRYGAPIGARGFRPVSDDEAGRLYLQRLRLVDGDYGADGTYWGRSDRGAVWCAFDAEGSTRLYVRARTREAAAADVLARMPSARFARRSARLSEGAA